MFGTCALIICALRVFPSLHRLPLSLNQALAAQIAAHSSPVVRTTTRTLRMAQEEQMERALQREADAQAVCYASPEFRARLEAMMAEKGKK